MIRFAHPTRGLVLAFGLVTAGTVVLAQAPKPASPASQGTPAATTASRQAGPSSLPPAARPKGLAAVDQHALVAKYCVSCHNDRMKAGDMSLATFAEWKATEHGETLERMIRKLRAGMMPPSGAARPDDATLEAMDEAADGDLVFTNFVDFDMLYGHRRAQKNSAAVTDFDAVVDLLGIEKLLDRHPRNLSGGERSRVALGRALLAHPDALLLDEPLAGLNYHEAERFSNLLLHLHQQGLSMLLVEHNLGEVMRVAKRLIVIDSGQVLADGEPKAVMSQPEVRRTYLGEAHA